MKEASIKTVFDRAGSTPYLTKVTLGRFELHLFHRGDADEDCHDHPCDFWTFPLVSYVEEYLDNGVRRTREVKAFRLHRRRAEFAHRIIGPVGNRRTQIATLVFNGKNRREWGFYTPEGWQHWRTYHDGARP